MFTLGEQAWELINIPDLTPSSYPFLSKVDKNHICILSGKASYKKSQYGVIINAKTGAVVKNIKPASKMYFDCYSQS